MGGRIEKIISAFKELGVQYAGPCHCTGDKALGLFAKRFGEKYLKIGAGRVVSVGEP